MATDPGRSTGGVQWPMGVDRRGAIAAVRGANAIARSIWVVLATRPGERLMRPDFGCGVWDALDREPGADRAALAETVRDALDRWVGEAQVDDVAVTESPSDIAGAGGVEILVTFLERRTQDRHSVSYRRSRSGDDTVVELRHASDRRPDELVHRLERGRGDAP